MPAAIGLRFYKIFAKRLRGKYDEIATASDLSVTIPDYLSNFVDSHSEDDTVADAEKERSYYFVPAENYGIGSIRGHVHYGTFGFESKIKKYKSKAVAYKRASSDTEEIALYFDIWCVPKEDFAILALQSFGGRSCVHLVLHDMQIEFEKANKDFRLHAHKLMGNDSPITLYGDAPVKKLKLTKHNAQSDSFGSYRPGKPPRPVDIEISYKAKRGGALGSLRDMGGVLNENDKGIIVFEGGEFDEVVAEVMIGNRRRPVGLIGANSETGAIDVSESITYGADGHPTLDSIKKQSNLIIQDFYKRLKSI
ncbi:hypothetical protein [Brevundimonas sp. M20]|uniref:hypothetical protein n=1 Tax=Brevundimonas sp. M20 TaxID=2591463 RepID=UPI001146B650|nr:hypothetical protein [Brevundimonas sp. M20]QDH73619.1 hypothetical protein FKQ52_09370 [Brevundimonas sp. M20]